MLQLYKRIFYGLYLWDHEYSRSSRHDLNAIVSLSGFVMMNIFSMLLVIQGISGHDVFGIVGTSSPGRDAIIFAVLMMLINYALISRIGVKNIIKEFEGKDAKRIKSNVVGYVAGTMLLLFVSISAPLWITFGQAH